MRPIRTLPWRSALSIVALIGLAAALPLALACGGEDSTPAESAGGSGDAAQIEIPEVEIPEDVPVEVTMGAMPEGYPSDLPTYPGATPTSSMLVPGGTGMLVLSSKQPADAVFAFYQKELPAQGWSVDEVVEDAMVVKASKGDRAATVKIGSAADATEIAIILAGG
jgi:hypothetical protein